MKKLFSVPILLMLALGLTVSMQSCLKENTDDCPPDGQPKVRIVVKTIAEQTRSAVYGTIDNVLLYIFDREGRFVGTWLGDAYTYGQEYVAELDIDPGTYHFVVWTNQLTAYQPNGDPDTAGQLVVSLQYPEDKKITTDIPDLHHGMLAEAEVVAGQSNEFLIILRPNTYRLNFTVEGLPATGDDYGFMVTDNNTHYLFDNTLVEGMDEIEYIRISNFTGNKINSSMKVLRLMDERTPLFDFSDITENISLYSDDLVQMIKTAYLKNGHTVDFDREFEFDIKLRFDAHLGVTVTINGWTYTSNPTPLG